MGRLNGDRTQAYTVGFVVDRFLEEINELDEVEISGKRWFTVEEAENLTLAPATKMFLLAYKKWLQTGAVQIVELDKDGEINLG